MDHAALTYLAIALKVGATLLGAIVLFVLVVVSRRRHRARQRRIDDAIVGRSGGSSEAPGKDRGED